MMTKCLVSVSACKLLTFFTSSSHTSIWSLIKNFKGIIQTMQTLCALISDFSTFSPENQSSHSLSMAKPYMKIDVCQVYLVDVLFQITETRKEILNLLNNFKFSWRKSGMLVVSIGGQVGIWLVSARWWQILLVLQLHPLKLQGSPKDVTKKL